MIRFFIRLTIIFEIKNNIKIDKNFLGIFKKKESKNTKEYKLFQVLRSSIIKKSKKVNKSEVM